MSPRPAGPPLLKDAVTQACIAYDAPVPEEVASDEHAEKVLRMMRALSAYQETEARIIAENPGYYRQ